MAELSPAARAYVDAALAAITQGDELPDVGALPQDVISELLDSGELDQLCSWQQDALEARGELVDWADRDSFEHETIEWYDRYADPYTWHEDLGHDTGDGTDRPDECEFYLGTHRPHWLYADGSRDARPRGPLFVSRRQLEHARRTAYPRCDTPFAIDSGGFTELRAHGGWETTPAQYVAQVRALAEQTGTLQWAAIMDWMVEDDALAKTGLTVSDHQALTCASYLTLVGLAPEIRWLPVLQGQTLSDYLQHLELYAALGVHLASHERVGVGSVCRRQASDEILEILSELAARGLRLHGFGVKTGGLEKAAPFLVSADSLAWSLGARRRGAPGDANRQSVAEAYRDAMLAIPHVVGRRPEPEESWNDSIF